MNLVGVEHLTRDYWRVTIGGDGFVSGQKGSVSERLEVIEQLKGECNRVTLWFSNL